MPGLRRIFIANFFSGTTGIGENIAYTLNVTNQITAMTVTTGSYYIINLTKEAAEQQDMIHASDVNGTLSYETNVNVYLSNYSTSLRNQIFTLASQKMSIITEDRQGQYWLVGHDGTGTIPSSSAGVDMVDSTAGQGKAYGDPNGYNIVFNSKEKVGPIEVLASVIPGITSN
jgi:hypothetical protein